MELNVLIFNNTALIMASLIGNLEVVRELLKRKEIEINVKDVLNRKSFILFVFKFFLMKFRFKKFYDIE